MKFFYLVLAIFFIACSSNSSDNEQIESSTDTLKNLENQSLPNVTAQKAEFLIIHGKDIWVREMPSTGEVIMKLNEGDSCRILAKGKLESIHGQPDYWYKIDYKEKQGWVFGSQTNRMLFKPNTMPLTGQLDALCDDTIISMTETPAAYSYHFANDHSFEFQVSAGYQISGKYEQNANNIKLKNLSLLVFGGEESKSLDLNGYVHFEIFSYGNIICLVQKQNTIKDKAYSPMAGSYCYIQKD